MLQGYVSQLRKVLGRDALRTEPPGYLLRVAPGQLDAERFEHLVEEARRGGPAAAADRLREALALWRGTPLPEFAFDSFAQTEIGRLEELRIAALEERLEADLALGRQAELVGELEVLVREHPLRERLRGQLILALYRSGRQAEALAAYQDTRRVLVEELGIEPGPRLQQLEKAILLQDPALELPVRGDVAAGPARLHTRRRPSPILAGAAILLLAAAATTAVSLLVRGKPGVKPITEVAANSVAVIDPKTNRLVGQVPVGSRPIAVAFGDGAVWVANAEDETVSRIDPKTRRVVKTIGMTVTDLAVDDGSVWVVSGSDGTLTRIEARSGAVQETLDLRGSQLVPNATLAVAAGGGDIWVTSTGGQVLRIDPATDATVARITVRPGPLAITFGEGAAWVGTLGAIQRIDQRTNTVTVSISPEGTPLGVAVGAGAVWAAIGSNATVWRIDASTGSVVKTIPVGREARGIAVAGGEVWLANSADGTVSRIDPQTNNVVTSIRVGHAPSDLAVGGGAVWVAVQAESAT